jgi:hypothetical protein
MSLAKLDSFSEASNNITLLPASPGFLRWHQMIVAEIHPQPLFADLRA